MSAGSPPDDRSIANPYPSQTDWKSSTVAQDAVDQKLGSSTVPIRSAVTVSLAPQAKGGPFVFWDDLDDACRQAAELGFDAVEIFAPGPDAVPADRLDALLNRHKLKLAAVGTGAGWVIHQLSLVTADAARRRAAIDFIKSMIEFGARHGAPAILGSMQGRWSADVPRERALDLLADALGELGSHADTLGVPFLYEPLNRYETNLFTQQLAAADWLTERGLDNVLLLCDLFHMNIEEQDLAETLRAVGSRVGHIHFVDSNRRAAGFGHMRYEPILDALGSINYQGYLSAEALPYPSSNDAALQTISTFRSLMNAAR